MGYVEAAIQVIVQKEEYEREEKERKAKEEVEKQFTRQQEELNNFLKTKLMELKKTNPKEYEQIEEQARKNVLENFPFLRKLVNQDRNEIETSFTIKTVTEVEMMRLYKKQFEKTV